MDITIMKLRETAELNSRGYYDLLLENLYTEDVGVGFKDLNIEANNTVSGTVVKRTVLLVNVFDTDTQSIVQREQFIVSEIDFVIDAETKLIEIYSSTRDVKKVVTTFLNTVNASVRLESLSLNPSEILAELKEQTDLCEITKLLIRDFSSEKGVSGNYDIKSVDTNLAWQLIDKYKNEVVRATVAVDIENIETVMQVFLSGKFKVTTKPRNNSNIIINLIKKLISKKSQ